MTDRDVDDPPAGLHFEPSNGLLNPEAAAQARMFKFWTPYKTTAELPRQLTRLLGRLT